jgi:hypothetical protein
MRRRPSSGWGGERHEALGFEPAQKAAHQPAVEPEISPHPRELAALRLYRAQNPRRPERPPPAQKRAVERAHLGRDRAVEAADAGGGIVETGSHDACL